MIKGQKKNWGRPLFLCFLACYLFAGPSYSAPPQPKQAPFDLSKLEQKGLSLSLPGKQPEGKKSPKALHIKAKVNQPFLKRTTTTSPKKLSPTALDTNQFQIGASLSQRTALYVTTSFKDVTERYESREWARQQLPKKNLIMPGVGFEWQPPEKLKVGKYQWRMPHKLSLSGELRADILKKDNAANSLKTLPSRLRFNAVLFKVHYTLGQPKK